jgi:hypothetical protein
MKNLLRESLTDADVGKKLLIAVIPPYMPYTYEEGDTHLPFGRHIPRLEYEFTQTREYGRYIVTLSTISFADYCSEDVDRVFEHHPIERKITHDALMGVSFLLRWNILTIIRALQGYKKMPEINSHDVNAWITSHRIADWQILCVAKETATTAQLA